MAAPDPLRERLLALVGRFPHQRVLVYGDLIADEFVYGTCDVEGTPGNIIIRVSGRGSASRGDVIHVTTDPKDVHVFDTETGERLSD